MYKKGTTVLIGVVIIGLVFALVSPVTAQGLGQTFEWPEIGFSMNYPDGWVESQIDSETRVLLSDPSIDVNADEPPDSPVVIILGLPGEFAGMMGSTQDVMQSFISEFGGETSQIEEFEINGMEALRAQGTPEEGFFADVVLVSGDTFLYILIGIWPSGQDFTNQFTAMLNTISVSEPAPPPAAQTTSVLVNGVRITLDQSITGSWNEIDAVELVGTADGTTLNQWAAAAEATSQYGDSSWSAAQATGAPDTTECGDITTAWASATATGYDALTLYFDTPVTPQTINIYQTYNPGAIVMVEVLPADGSPPITVFEGVDETRACPGVFSVPVTFGGGGMLTYGESATGIIDDTTFAQDWTFTGNAGDTVTITMVALDGDLDPNLFLLDSAGNQLAENDDADDPAVGAFNAQIANFTLPASGTYIIRATRFGEEFGSSTGSYQISLEAGGMTQAPSGSDTIAYGQAVGGSITEAMPEQDWQFSGNAGDVVTITMSAAPGTSLDAYLSLLDNNGQEIASNDDAGIPTLGVFDSQIAQFALPYSGAYTIRASRLSGTGAYTLTLEAGEGGSAAMPISYNETVSGMITDTEYRQLWTFEGTAGDAVTITMVATDDSDSVLDSYLTLIGPSGTEVASNDDADDTSVGALNAQIAKFILPETGAYTIIATRFGEEFGSGTGPYELTLQKLK
ncbi:MAG: hypothetical protein Kow0077_06320 [Anaerolineae bacterium]